MSFRTRLISLSLFFSAIIAMRPAVAAESYESCSGFVDSLPAVITTQGNWCLRADLSTAIATGAAIQVSVNNVTLDCNHFKLGGLAAGPGTQATGISALSVLNTVVRNCNVRGFATGIRMTGSGGTNLVEDNRLEGNTEFGIRVTAPGATIRRNLVVDTGPGSGASYGIFTNRSVTVTDNTVSGVVSGETFVASGIGVGAGFLGSGDGSRVSGNHVRDVEAGSMSYGILAGSGRYTFVDNQIHGPVEFGLYCGSGSLAVARDNIVFDATTPISNCSSVSNTIRP